jgi:serine/threonine protein kinase
MPSYKNKKKSKRRNSNRNRTKLSKRGGVVLGVGSYGCVINPNIYCKNYISDDKYISKLVNTEDIGAEYNIIKVLKLNELDNFEKYIIIPLDICDMRINYTKNETKELYNKHKLDIDECVKKFPKIQNMFNMSNIIQEYGGLSFNEYRQQNMKQTITENIPYYVKLFEAIIFLNMNNIVHRDIKHDNIVIDTKNKTVRLIDFGLAMSTDDVFNIKNVNNVVFFYEEQYRKGYFIWPVELYVFSNVYDNTNHNINHINKDVYNNYYNEYNYWLIQSDKKMYEKRIQKELDDINVYIDYINVQKDKKRLKRDWKIESNKKLDVFSLGIFLMIEIKLLEDNSPKSSFISELKDFIYDTMIVQNSKNRFSIDLAYDYFIQICDNYNIPTNF